MQRITTLLQKISELAENGDNSAIETDLMLDYTRQLYADLLAHRSEIMDDAISQPARTIPIQSTYNTHPTHESEKPNIIELQVSNTSVISSHAVVTAPKDIRTSIGINDKYQIISELFSNRKDAYEAMIDQLNTFDTELDALTWLQDHMYFEYSWSEDSEALMILHGLLHKFYNNK